MFQDLRWMNDPDAVVYFDGSPAGERRAAAPAASNFAQADALSSIDFVQLAGDLASRQEKIFESLKNINALVKMGSYAWVVSGEKTASGNPILYSGPQMDHAFSFATPSIISEGSINAGGVNISGMTMAGMPVIIIGRTPHHAWSMQVGHAHTLDYYSVTQADIIHQRVETFKVAGMPDVEQTVYRTAYGPVVNADPMISWKYAHWGKEFQTVEAYMEAAMATSMDEFGAAIDKIGLSQHFCYADRDGNFAYWMSGFDPVRAEGADPRFPQLGDGTQDWPEPVQYKPRSTDRNRAEGFYSGWNNKSSSVYTSAPNTSSYYFGPFHRAHVLEDYLSSQDNLTFEDVRDLALNIATTDSVRTDFLGGNINSYGDGGNPWKFVESDFTAAVQANATPERTAALAVMDGWDGHFVAGGPENWAMGMDRADAWILMNAWIREVIRLTFEDELGTGQSTGVLFNVLLHGLPNYPTSITNLYDWFSNPADPDAPQTAEAIIIQALDATLTTLGEQPWGVGKRGMMVYSHEMIGPLHSLPTSSRSTYAQCVEMGAAGPVRVESMLPVGQSGNIMINIFTDPPTPVFDPNFFSMAPVYDPFAHRDFPTP
ncbi:MAG: penicillin acylase family protein, partial [Desulfobacterales bacterium]|nr:penicillin acylase family protein [Desulfobacterales bacterium]